MMKKITFSADESLIEKAMEKASREKKTLNALFREWLVRYVGQESTAGEYRSVMEKLDYVKAGGKFTRDELNER